MIADGNTGVAAGEYTIEVKAVDGHKNLQSTENATGKWSISQLSIAEASSSMVKDLAWKDGGYTLSASTFGNGFDASFKVGDVPVAAADYALSFEDAQGNKVTKADKVGAYHVVLDAKVMGNFTGQAKIPFSVGSLTTTPDMVTVKNADTLTYTGKPVATNVQVVVAKDGQSVPTTGYTAKFYKDGKEIAKGDIVDAGTYQVVVEGVSPYAGKVTTSFKVKPADASAVTASVAKGKYTGQPVEPQASAYVTATKVALTEGVDFDVVYADNVNAGNSAVAIFTFKGNYTGTKKVDFVIDKADFDASKVTVEGVHDFVYSGNNNTAFDDKATYTLDGEETVITSSLRRVIAAADKEAIMKGLADGTETFDDLTAGKKGNVAKVVGDYAFIVKVAGDANRSDGYVAVDFKVTPFDLSKVEAIQAGDGAVYKTTALENTAIPTFSIAADKLVVDGELFDASKIVSGIQVIGRDNNEQASGNFAAAPCTYGYRLVSSDNNVEGSGYTIPVQVVSHKDNNLAAEDAQVNVSGTYEYTGSAVVPANDAVSVKVGATELKLGEDFEIVGFEDNVEVGIATVTVKGVGKYSGEATGEFTISIRTVEAGEARITVEAEGLVYDGTAKEPAVTVEVASADEMSWVKLSEDDYTVAYDNNVNAGEHTATVTLNNKHFDYKGAPLTGTFEIATANPADMDVVFSVNPTAVKSDGATNVAVAQIVDGVYVYAYKQGVQVAPEIFKITANGVELTANTDFTPDPDVASNWASAAAKGDQKFTIKGSGNYEGEAE